MIMLDLETFGSGSNAAVCAIGAVKFDPISGTVFDRSSPMPNGTFYRVLNVTERDGVIEPSTLYWWLEQSDLARRALCVGDRVATEIGLKDFATWVRDGSCTGMWGNGADFDNVVLSNAYKRYGYSQPWSYGVNRCYRTIKNLGGAKDIKMVREGTHHNALDDAISQARHLCTIIKTLNLSL